MNGKRARQARRFAKTVLQREGVAGAMLQPTIEKRAKAFVAEKAKELKDRP